MSTHPVNVRPTPQPSYALSMVGDESALVIQLRKHWPSLILSSVFTLVWLAIWAAVEAGTIYVIWTQRLSLSEVGKDIPLLIFGLIWVPVWTISGLSTIARLLQDWFGQERVRITQDALEIRREFLGWATCKRYPMNDVKHLRVELPPPTAAGEDHPKPPSIAFDYRTGGKRFGVGLPENEATEIVAQLVARYPGLR